MRPDLLSRLAERADPAKERYTSLLQAAVPAPQAAAHAALEFLESALGGHWTSLSFDGHEPPAGQPSFNFRVLEQFLDHSKHGIASLSGKLCMMATVPVATSREAQICQLVQEVAEQGIVASLAAAHQLGEHDPIVSSLFHATRSLERDSMALCRVLRGLFADHPLSQAVSRAAFVISWLQLAVDQRQELRTFLQTVRRTMLELPADVRYAGYSSFYRGVLDANVTDLLGDVDAHEMNALRIGVTLIESMQLFGGSQLEGALWGSLAFAQPPTGRRLFQLLAVEQDGRRVVPIGIGGMSSVGTLILRSPKLAQDIVALLETAAGQEDRLEALFWLMDHPQFLPLCQSLSRRGLSDRGRAALLTACQEDADRIPQFQAAATSSNQNAALFSELAELGSEVLVDSALRQRVFEAGKRNPQAALPLLRAWREALQSGAPARAQLMETLLQSVTMTAQEVSTLLPLARQVGDEALKGLLQEGARTWSVKRLARELRAIQHAATPVSAVLPTKLDPIEVHLRQLTDSGHAKLAEELGLRLVQLPGFRRGLRTLFEHVQGGTLLALLDSAATAVGSTTLTKIASYAPLRRGFGRLLERDTARAAAVLTLTGDDEQWIGIQDLLLQSNQAAEELTDEHAQPEGSAPKRERLRYGIWRGVRRVLVLGGEYTGTAAELVRNAVPGVHIEVVETLSANAIRPVLQGDFGLYVSVSQWMRHDVELRARRAQQRSGALWHWFHRRSPKLLAAELRYGFGVLEKEASEEG